MMDLILTDIAFVLGGALGSVWWHGVHKRKIAVRDAWYVENAKAKGQQ
jgi:hypothetical protein